MTYLVTVLFCMCSILRGAAPGCEAGLGAPDGIYASSPVLAGRMGAMASGPAHIWMEGEAEVSLLHGGVEVCRATLLHGGYVECEVEWDEVWIKGDARVDAVSGREAVYRVFLPVVVGEKAPEG